MSPALDAFVAASLDRAVPDEVAAIAAQLGREAGAEAVLFYGSNLRSGSLDGVLDFYALLPGRRERGLWPRVSYREFDRDGEKVRAKIATMRLSTFMAAARGKTRDTTIWARFVQPAALVWSSRSQAGEKVTEAVAACSMTAGGFAAVLGPAEGPAEVYWQALFRATYAAEFRVEAGQRGDGIVAHDRDRLARLLPLAWSSAGIGFSCDHGTLHPILEPAERARRMRRWRRAARWGKPLNIARLAKAAFTFDGAARYAAWKIERHTGVAVVLTPWRERHPLLAAPGVLWRVWRAQRG